MNFLSRNVQRLFISVLLINFLSCNSTKEQSSTPTVNYLECSEWPNWESKDNLTCAYIEVPENHKEPKGKKIKLAFSIMKSNNKKGNPTLFLTGGPGGDAMRNMSLFSIDSLLLVGDVILIDQRGMGKSSVLHDISEESLHIMAGDNTMDEEIEEMGKLMQKLKDSLERSGVNLAMYNTTQNAHDFGMLMDALPYEKYNLWGGSYGTQLGTYIMKYYPEKIHASVLTAPATINHDALENRFRDFANALNRLFEHCDSTPDCLSKYGDLKSNVLAALENLEEKPITINVDEQDFVINPQDAVFIIRYLLYKPDAVQLLSDFGKAVVENDEEQLKSLYKSSVSVFNGFNGTTFYCFAAYDEFSDSTLKNLDSIIKSSPILSKYGLAWFQSSILNLPDWSSERASSQEKELQNISVPTMVITNDFDPATPPENAKLYKEVIPEAHIVNTGTFGHGVFSPCLGKIRRDFLISPKDSPNTDCF